MLCDMIYPNAAMRTHQMPCLRVKTDSGLQVCAGQRYLFSYLFFPCRLSILMHRYVVVDCFVQALVIGAGPCGLRVAIETALLGARVVIVEKRDSFSRNNVLHLWPHTIHDLKALGAKKFFGKFCAGSIDHISE